VELVEHRALPALLKHRRGVVHAAQAVGAQGDGLGVHQVVLRRTVGELNAALGRVAAFEHEVQLAFVNRKLQAFLGDLLLHVAEERIGGGEHHPRPDRPAFHVLRGPKMPAGRSAAVVAHPVDPQDLLQPGVFLDREQQVGHVRGDLAVVAVGRVIVSQHPAAVLTLPPVQLRGAARGHRLKLRAGTAVVIVAADATPGENPRQRPAVAESVGLPVDLHRVKGQAELVPEPAAGVQQVAAENLARRQILAALHPLAGRGLPAALLYALADSLKQLRRVLLHGVIDGRLALGKVEARELVHQAVHGAEGVMGDGHGLGPAPHPVHVNVRVPGAVDRVLLGGG